MNIQSVDILEISIAIAPAELSRVGLGPEMPFECFLVTENAVILTTKAVEGEARATRHRILRTSVVMWSSNRCRAEKPWLPVEITSNSITPH
jgi:hypothetical protein